MNKATEAIEERALVQFPQAQAVLGVSRRTLKRILSTNGIPIVQISPRKQAIMLAHLDILIAAHAKPVLADGNNHGK